MPDTNELLNYDTFHGYVYPTSIKFAVIARTTDGDVVAAVASKQIRVLALTISITGTNATWQFRSGSGGSNLTGALSSAYSDSNEIGLFETAAGASLYLDVAGTTPSAQGHLTYVEI